VVGRAVGLVGLADVVRTAVGAGDAGVVCPPPPQAMRMGAATMVVRRRVANGRRIVVTS
jgi:hypothetical protein